MSEIKNPEAMVQDQNLNAAPNDGTDNENIQKKDMFNTEDVELSTIGKVSTGEEPAKEPDNTETQLEDITKDESDSTTEPDAPAEDGTTEPKAAVKLSKFRIYSSSELGALGVRLARIVDNRELDSKAVNKKIASIKNVKGVISPTQLVPARKCLEQGHEVKLLDGTVVTEDTKDLDDIYVIVDGQHRDEAIRKIKDNPKETEKYENYYYVPLIDAYIVSDILRETNVATYPWKDRQYINNLLMLKGDSAVNLDLLKEIQAHPKATTKAALHWLTWDASKTLYSRQIVAAMVDDNILKKIAAVDKKKLDAGKDLFNAAEYALGDLAGTTPYSNWALDQLKKDPSVAPLEMAAKLTQFFKWLKEHGASTYKSLKGSRATKETEYVAKETVIHQQLTKDYTLYTQTLSE